MTMRNGLRGCAFLATLATAGLANADPAISSLLGDLNNAGKFSSVAFNEIDHVPNGGSRGQFGLEFTGISLVNSFAFTQYAGRARVHDATFKTSDGQTFNTTFPDTLTPSYTFPVPVTTSYVLMSINSRYISAGEDPNTGFQTVTVGGSVVTPDVNVNRSAGATISTIGGFPGLDFPAKLNDGLVNGDTDATGNRGTNSTFFIRDAGRDSVTVNYTSPKTVASIGLGLETYTPGPADPALVRDIPKFVTITGSNGVPQNVSLGSDPGQYGRLNLTTPLVGTTSLTLTFPDGSNAGDYFIHGDGNYGLIEFEAFVAPAPVPEPFVGGAVLAIAAFGATVSRRRGGTRRASVI